MPADVLDACSRPFRGEFFGKENRAAALTSKAHDTFPGCNTGEAFSNLSLFSFNSKTCCPPRLCRVCPRVLPNEDWLPREQQHWVPPEFLQFQLSRLTKLVIDFILLTGKLRRGPIRMRSWDCNGGMVPRRQKSRPLLEKKPGPFTQTSTKRTLPNKPLKNSRNSKALTNP